MTEWQNVIEALLTNFYSRGGTLCATGGTSDTRWTGRGQGGIGPGNILLLTRPALMTISYDTGEAGFSKRSL